MNEAHPLLTQEGETQKILTERRKLWGIAGLLLAVTYLAALMTFISLLLKGVPPLGVAIPALISVVFYFFHLCFTCSKPKDTKFFIAGFLVVLIAVPLFFYFASKYAEYLQGHLAVPFIIPIIISVLAIAALSIKVWRDNSRALRHESSGAETERQYLKQKVVLSVSLLMTLGAAAMLGKFLDLPAALEWAVPVGITMACVAAIGFGYAAYHFCREEFFSSSEKHLDVTGSGLLVQSPFEATPSSKYSSMQANPGQRGSRHYDPHMKFGGASGSAGGSPANEPQNHPVAGESPTLPRKD